MKLVVSLALTAALGACGGDGHGDKADLVMKNGTIYTVNGQQEWANSVAVKDGKIVYVGDDSGSARFESANTKVVDLKGRMVLPGFVDGHNHAYLMAESLYWLSLNPYSTLDERQKALRDYRAKNPGMKQLRAVGWMGQEAAAKGVLAKQLIDEVIADIPVLIIANDHHGAYANSKALQLAGIDRNTPDPTGGVIERDPATGEPTGVLYEFAAQNMVIQALPQPDFTVDQYKETIRTWQKAAGKDGITSAFVPVHYPTESLLQALQQMDKGNELTAQYDLALWADENKGVSQVDHLKSLRNTYQGNHFKVDSIKIFADGVGAPKLVWDQKVLEDTVVALDKEKFRVYVHAIGNPDFFPSNNVLNAFQVAAAKNGSWDSRHSITHLDWVRGDDLVRFKQLNVLAVPQAAWFGKGWYNDVTGDKAKNKQRFQSFIDAGITVVSSSDFPSTDTFERDMYPPTGLEVGMTRLDPDKAKPGDLPSAMEPWERATLKEMITSYTINGAKLMFQEKNRGSIEVGKKADLVVMDRNLFDLAPTDVGEAKVMYTIFEGKESFRDPAF
ncbi:amidohydrolase [Comamonas humi]